MSVCWSLSAAHHLYAPRQNRTPDARPHASDGSRTAASALPTFTTGQSVQANVPQSATDTETSELVRIHAEYQPLPGAVRCSRWAVLAYCRHTATFFWPLWQLVCCFPPAPPKRLCTYGSRQTGESLRDSDSFGVFEKPPAQSSRAVAPTMAAMAVDTGGGVPSLNSIRHRWAREHIRKYPSRRQEWEYLGARRQTCYCMAY